MDEHIDEFERRIRIKELRLAFLRGDISLEEHDRRAARYGPSPVVPRMAVPDRRKVSKLGQILGRFIRS